MQDQWTLRIHLTFMIRIPYEASIFQALVLAFWRFQSIGMVELLKAVLEAMQERIVRALQQRHPGRFRQKGRRMRTLELPFGRLNIKLVRLRVGRLQF